MNSLPSNRNTPRLVYLLLIFFSLALTLFLFAVQVSWLGMNRGQQVIIGVVFMFLALFFFIRYQNASDEETS